MPSREPRKQPQLSKGGYRFTSAADVKRALRAQDESNLIESLTALRNQLTVKYNEGALSPNDERLNLARSWLQVSSGAQDVFDIWEAATSRQMSLLSLVVAVLSSILNLLSVHYTDHALAQPVCRSLLSSQWIYRLNSYLSGSHTELVLVTLKLFNSLSYFAGGKERKAVLDAFAWETKTLSKLLYMRRKGKAGESVDVLARPDIRTLYVLFILSFVEGSTPSSTKSAFLEQHRDVFTSIFKGLAQDSYLIVRRVLEVCWTGLWSDSKVRKTLKITLFNEQTLAQLVRLYDRTSSEDGELDRVPADVVHHFMLAICTRPGTGLCFKDRGWYPRESDSADGLAEVQDDTPDDVLKQRGSRVYNKILANVLKTLKVNEDPRQQELAYKILAACPELVAGYWVSASLALEPRLSSKWIANIAFLGSIVALPVPTTSFLLPSTGTVQELYHPAPPPLATIRENVVPAASLKTHISRALQAPAPLVQHCAALTLAKCLSKYAAVCAAFQQVERALEEDDEGQWTRRRRELEREVRKRIPEFQVVVGFSQKLGEAAKTTNVEVTSTENGSAPDPARHPAQIALLTESAQRLVWLYHRAMPTLVAEARFDVGKLLQGFQDADAHMGFELASATAGLDVLRQLHVLRLLRESDQFSWSSKTGASQSNFYTLLKVFVQSEVLAIRAAIISLLRHVLSASVIFQHDADEVSLWIDSLPTTFRAADVKIPGSSGAPLTDEGHAVISFLDDCVQRCVKTPYRYLEDLQALVASSAEEDVNGLPQTPEYYDDLPSPLLMTVLEQFDAKFKGRLISVSDALAIMSFVRKLSLRLASKLCRLDLLDAFAERFTGAVQLEHLLPDQMNMSAAIKREVMLLAGVVRQLRHPSATLILNTNPAVEKFLSSIEQHRSETAAAGRIAAFELVDWHRLVSQPLSSSDVNRLVVVISRLYRPALKEFFEYLNPEELCIWEDSRLVSQLEHLQDVIGFEVLWTHCTDAVLAKQEVRRIIVENLFQKPVRTVVIKRALRLICHRLHSASQDEFIGDLILVQATILKRAKKLFPPSEFIGLAEAHFQHNVMTDYCRRPLGEVARQGLTELLDVTMDPADDATRQLLTDFTAFWCMTARQGTDSLNDDQISTAFLWMNHSEIEELLPVLDTLFDSATTNRGDIMLVERLIHDIAPRLSSASTATSILPSRLLQMRSLLPQSQVLESLIASTLLGSLPLCHDGFTASEGFDSNRLLVDVIPKAQSRWSRCVQSNVQEIDITPFLEQTTWSSSAIEIITCLMYRQTSARSAVVEWLKRDTSAAPFPVADLARIIFVLSDTESLPVEGVEFLLPHFNRLVRAMITGKSNRSVGGLGPDSLCCKCVAAMIETLPTLRTKLLARLRAECQSLTPSQLSYGMLWLGERLSRSPVSDASDFLQDLADQGLSWAVRYFSGTETGGNEGLVELSTIISSSTVKNHLAEPVLAAAIQNRFKDRNALRFVRKLISKAQFKPVVVNRHLQSIVQHPLLYELSGSFSPEDSSLRGAIIDLLHTLFYLHPNNTCQPTHIEPLRRLYGGTLSSPDRRLLSVFRLFESTRKTSMASLFVQWSSAADAASNSTLDAIQSLEPTRVLKTCLTFPDRRRLHELTLTEDAGFDSLLYDPAFVVLLFAQMLADGAPSSALSWVQLFRTNVVSLLIRMLSARDDGLRETALAQIAALYQILQDADMQEKPHVLHILNLLRDLLSSCSANTSVPRLSAYMTLLLAHALRGIFYPSNFIYPLTARFLLQRPTLDQNDVPMLFGMLYSAGDDWKKERAWMVRFLADGMVGDKEWRVLRGRHTWDLLASLFQSEQKDLALRRGVLEVLANITCHARATTSLVLKNALLAWIEMQLPHVCGDEGVAWIRILENVVVVTDAAKMETATNGEWRFALSRCLSRLVASTACTLDMFVLAVPIALRLSLLPGPSISGLQTLLSSGLSWLAHMEKDIKISEPLPETFADDAFVMRKALPPHPASWLFDAPHTHSVESWGMCVEALWRIAMTGNQKCKGWDELTARILVWRSIKGEGSAVGEWARKAVLRNLRGAWM